MQNDLIWETRRRTFRFMSAPPECWPSLPRTTGSARARWLKHDRSAGRCLCASNPHGGPAGRSAHGPSSDGGPLVGINAHLIYIASESTI
jgi:hypothetical protein